MSIKIELTADTPEALRTLLCGMISALDVREAAIVQDGPDSTSAAIFAGDGAVADAKADAEAEAPDDSGAQVVKDLSPKEARAQAIKELHVYFASNPSAMTSVSRLQNKYGVKTLKDVEDDRAHDLLADALLLVNGTPEDNS